MVVSFAPMARAASTYSESRTVITAPRAYIRDYSYMCLFPGLAIMITILSLNLLGDGLRDALDPRLR